MAVIAVFTPIMSVMPLVLMSFMFAPFMLPTLMFAPFMFMVPAVRITICHHWNAFIHDGRLGVNNRWLLINDGRSPNSNTDR